jgi:Flp pilus assembly protein TadG
VRNTARLRHGISIGKAERGYILIAFSLSALFVLGMCGLALDLGRMYVAKSEAQSFVDAAALNAAVQLALNPGAFTAAGNAAAATAKQWEFATKPFTNVVTQFGTGPADTFIESPPGTGHTASDYTFAQVTARVNLPLYLLPVVVRSANSSIAATAVAGQAAVTGLPGGEFPFSPVSRSSRPDCPDDPFGYCVGTRYTLRWPPPGHAKGNVCATDVWDDRGTWGSQWRGYCCVSGNNVPALERAIMLGQGTVPLDIGDPVPDPPGQKEAIDIGSYFDYDTDTSSSTYAAYLSRGTGNGKRIVTVPVNDPGTHRVVGFAAFFLPSPDDKFEICGEYIGSVVQGLPGLPPKAGSGVWRLRLYR